MEKLIVFVVLIATCSATVEDLSGKVLVFSRESTSDHVKLLTQRTQMESMTLCLRFFTDLNRGYGLFSLSTSQYTNAFHLLKPNSGANIQLAIKDSHMVFQSLSSPPNTWHSICATWDVNSGLGQLWMDGKPSVKRYITTGSVSSTPITILGQHQSSHGGTFVKDQSFLGMISQVHMWDYIVSPYDIRRYVAGKHFTPGNVFNWGALDIEIVGKVSIEEESAVM